MTGVPEKSIFRSVTEYNKKLSNQCNLPAQIEIKETLNVQIYITSSCADTCE